MPNPIDTGSAGRTYQVAVDQFGDKNPKPQTIAAPAPAKQTHRAAQAKSGSDYTAHTWAVALLNGLGMPVTSQNVQAIVAWEAAEGGHWNNTAWYNPINTTQTMAGSHIMGNGGPGAKAGVQAYTSWKEGLQATIQTLRNGLYGNILDALRQGNNAGAVAQAIVNSKWGTDTINLDANNSAYGTVHRDPSTQGVYGASINPTDSAQLTKADFVQGLDAAGFPKALINSNPELKRIFDEATQGKWWQSQAGQERFLTAVKSTQWWKKTSDTQRHYEALKLTNPTEYNVELTQNLADVRASATQLGLPLTDSELNALALRKMTFGLDSNQMNSLLADHINYKSGEAFKGQLGVDVNDIQNMASDYYVKISDQNATQLLRQLTAGQLDPNSLTDYFKELAISKFPHLTKQLNAGQTVAQVADPFKQEVASILEKDPNGIANDDPLVMKGLQQPDGNGGFQLMPMYQFDSMLKQDPRWLQTNNARQSLMDTGIGILQKMGLSV